MRLSDVFGDCDTRADYSIACRWCQAKEAKIVQKPIAAIISIWLIMEYAESGSPRKEQAPNIHYDQAAAISASLISKLAETF